MKKLLLSAIISLGLFFVSSCELFFNQNDFGSPKGTWKAISNSNGVTYPINYLGTDVDLIITIDDEYLTVYYTWQKNGSDYYFTDPYHNSEYIVEIDTTNGTITTSHGIYNYIKTNSLILTDLSGNSITLEPSTLTGIQMSTLPNPDPDQYENDDTKFYSNPINQNEIQEHTFSKENDIDYVYLNLTADVTYTITATPEYEEDLVLTLYKDNNIVESEDSGNHGEAEVITFTPSTSGTYYLEIKEYYGYYGKYKISYY